ncbi:trypco2 family protein [Glycomyces dulcitolivorans]|uniref:trypco2 family protein n=1 Tax=Glycomyces dulcitolivorans TaxID=2200759 RepID=UPI00130048FA|nr:trypco2 family protein [Glycomyces dulcitolivorans]
MSNPSLGEALSSLRNELRDAHLTSDPELRLVIKEIQLDLAVEFVGDVEVKAGATAWRVLKAEASGRVSSTNSHHISLKIEPELVKNETARVSFEVSTEPIRDTI